MSDEQRSGICHELSVDCPSYKFLFTTPETILTAEVQNVLQTMFFNHTLAQFVIEEHTVLINGDSISVQAIVVLEL